MRRSCHKLVAKFFGPFRVIEKIEAVVYRLQLPGGSKIHDVFHVSQLKAVLGPHQQIQITELPSL